ncbi:DUF4127 family protein [Paenibacillus sp. GCM10023252]|uniref:DUF4127 family protein n=1 Tax=Paenibacillus sp. GCM10023252 TaxID=3252649 RepID=UPI00361B88A6
MNHTILLLPVDARPVTRELPCQIAHIGGWSVQVPEERKLGFLKSPGDVEWLHAWLKSEAEKAEGLVLSIDMLLYGGLVPSRVNTDSLEAVSARLAIIRELKRLYPAKSIMAFSSTMRISNNYVNEEEKEYWSSYGEELWSYSYYTHHYERTGDVQSQQQVERLLALIPEAILADYLATRERNYLINQELLAYVEDGSLELLVFPQDDTAEYGLNIREQQLLEDEVSKRGLYEQVLIYPGADEVAGTLVSRMIIGLEGVPFPTFYPLYSGEKGALVPAMYEDRPLAESAKGQIFALGGCTVETAAEADLVLALNVPGKRQGDLALQKYLGEVNTADRNIGEWLNRIKRYIGLGYKVAIADVAYANGADEKLVPRLLKVIPVKQLSGFAAWNTAGNTLGTVVAQAAMVYLQSIKPSVEEQEVRRRLQEQLVLRLLEDYVYQSQVRQQVRALGVEGEASAEELLRVVQDAFEPEAKRFMNDYAPDAHCEFEQIFLPWNRTFEIGLRTSLTLVK